MTALWRTVKNIQATDSWAPQILVTPVPSGAKSGSGVSAQRDSRQTALLISPGLRGMRNEISDELIRFAEGRKFSTILADPPWQFKNRTGKIAPEHKRLSRYGTLSLEEICSLPLAKLTTETAHLYLWVPNALLPFGLRVMAAWGFEYKSNIIWHKVRKDGGSDGRGVGFYFRNVTEMILFGVRGKHARTLAPGRRQVNVIESRKREHSRKPDEQYALIQSCSPGPYLEIFSRGVRRDWASWGNQADSDYRPTWETYKNHSQAGRQVSVDT